LKSRTDWEAKTAEKKPYVKEAKATEVKPGVNTRKCYKCNKIGWTKDHVCQPTSSSVVVNNGIQAIEDQLDEMFSSSSTTVNVEKYPAPQGTTPPRPKFTSPEPYVSQTPDLNLLYTPVEINGVPAQALVDSGGNVSFINNDLVKQHKWEIEPATKGWINHQGLKRDRIGTVSATVRNGNKTVVVHFEILDQSTDQVIIGLKDFKILGYSLSGVPVKPPGATETVAQEMEVDEEPIEDSDGINDPRVVEALRENADIDILTPCTHPLAVFHVEVEAEPTHWARRNFIKPSDYSDVAKVVYEWKAKGVIAERTAAITHCYSLLVVDKKDEEGKKEGIRVCIDLRPLNAIMKNTEFPLPTIPEIISKIGQCSGPNTRRSKIDCTQAYMRFKCTGEPICFQFDSKMYQFKVAMFGAKPMTSIFQRVAEDIARPLATVQAYIDDFSFAENSYEEAIVTAVALIKRLTRFKIIVNRKKSRIACIKIILLGHCLGPCGVTMVDTKVQELINWPEPTTGKSIMRFLGAANYYRSYIKNYSLISKPLDELRNAPKKFDLQHNKEAYSAFCCLREAIRKASSLVYEDPALGIYVGVDASDVGVGAWRAQKKKMYKHLKDDELREEHLEFIEFISKAFPGGRNYASATMKELQGLIYAFKKFMPHLQGRKFIVFTDHRALVHLFTKKEPSALFHRWIDLLLLLDFTVIHWPGLDNTIADSLSRINSSSVAKSSPLTENKDLKVIEDYHALGHFASSQIYTKLLRDGHFWSGMRQDIDKFIQSCESCQRVNLIREGFHPLTPITAKLPMDHVAIDLKEMPETPMHEKYLLVMADIATDYMVLKVLKNKDEYSVARALWEIFAFLGLPTIIQSDNGAEFVNKVLKALVELHGIDHRLVAAYHPRANGFVERKNFDIQQIFKKVLNGAIHEWVPWVPFVQLAYNNRISSRTGSTAFSLMFGRALRIFKEPVAADASFDLSRWQENIEQMHNLIYPIIAERVVKLKEKQAATFNATHKIVDDIPEGSIVYVKDDVEKSKWVRQNQGPFKVVRKTRGNAYILEDRTGNVLASRFPPRALKVVDQTEFTPDNTPSYYVQKILNHEKLPTGAYKYLVKFKGVNESQWISATDFDGGISIAKYWKALAKKDNNDGQRLGVGDVRSEG
jgi:hypothetical protein